jgi:hypothetical protein
MIYKIHTTEIEGICLGSVLLVDTNTVIPFDPANTDYQAYLKWVEEGNEPEPADEPKEQS